MNNYPIYDLYYNAGPNFNYTQYPMVNPYQMMFPKKRSIVPLNLQSTLRTAQKTLNTVNQIIPVIYQVRPILNNAKTAFRVIKAVNQMDLSPSYDQEIDEAINTSSSLEFENML